RIGCDQPTKGVEMMHVRARQARESNRAQQCIALPGRVEAAQPGERNAPRLRMSCGEILICTLVENRARIAHACAEARRRARGALPPAFTKHGYDALAHEIAVEVEARVRRVFDPVESPRCGDRTNLGARKTEQWTRESARAERASGQDPAQAAYACATHDALHDRLELVVGVVRRQERFAGRQMCRERRVAGVARRGLEPFAT